jgi:hypothetical protein
VPPFVDLGAQSRSCLGQGTRERRAAYHDPARQAVTSTAGVAMEITLKNQLPLVVKELNGAVGPWMGNFRSAASPLLDVFKLDMGPSGSNACPVDLRAGRIKQLSQWIKVKRKGLVCALIRM